jgi:hypothetical protein
MKKLIVLLLLAASLPALAVNDYLNHGTGTGTITSTDVILFETAAGVTYKIPASSLQAWAQAGTFTGSLTGTASFASGAAWGGLTSIPAPVANLISNSGTISLSGVVLTLPGSSVTLADLGTSGTASSANFLRGDFKWAAALQSATASGTNVYTATPSPALGSYVTGQTLLITFANANTGGASLNLNSLGAVPIEQNGAAVNAGQIPAGCTLALVYDGTDFDIIGNSSAAYSLPQATTTVPGGVTVDGTTIQATAGVISTVQSVHVITGNALTAGTTTVTIPSGVTHVWVQDTNSSTTNVGALIVTISGTTATVTSTNGADTSTFDLFYWK